MKKSFFTLGVSLCAMLSAHVSAETGVTDATIKIGVSNAQTGPASGLGLGLLAGAKVYFDKVNDEGGVHGRKIEMVVYDDQYEPDQTVSNTKKLIEEDNVFALFGYVGTPTSKVAVPMAVDAEVPYFGPFTGAEFLRNPVIGNVFNVRASYFDEAEQLVHTMVDGFGKQKIAAFIQNDGYGAAGLAGIEKALEKRGLEPVAIGRYERNTVDVAAGLAEVKASNPDVVIMIGAYKPVAAFMKAAKAQGMTADFMNISFVGTSSLLKELGADAEGSYISQVVPSPTGDGLFATTYRAAMEEAGKSADIGYTSLEGYLDAAVFVEGLKQAGKDLTREEFVSSLESISTSFGELPVTFSETNHQALNQVFLTKVAGGEVVEIDF